jgi:predicted nucleic acid-binding protein
MRLLLDTSVLVAAMVEADDHHARAFPWLQRVQTAADSGVVAAHSLAEVYAILTRLPLRPRLSATDTQQLIQHNILGVCEIVALDATDYTTMLEHLAVTGIVGGATYDALILYTARKITLDQIVTFNTGDFQRLFPDLVSRIVAP